MRNNIVVPISLLALCSCYFPHGYSYIAQAPPDVRTKLEARLGEVEKHYSSVAESKAAYLASCQDKTAKTDTVARTSKWTIVVVDGQEHIILHLDRVATIGVQMCEKRFLFEVVCPNTNVLHYAATPPSCDVLESGQAAAMKNEPPANEGLHHLPNLPP
jgi:hypothetical protein